jgi:hypothetical protein
MVNRSIYMSKEEEDELRAQVPLIATTKTGANRCQALKRGTLKARQPSQCGRIAHPGSRTCILHGGRGSGRPPIKPKYSSALAEKARSQFESYLTDPEILTMTSEIAAARTFLHQFMETNEAPNAEGIESIINHLEKISRIVEREHRRIHGQQYTITVRGMIGIVAQVSDIVTRVINENVVEVRKADRIKDAIAGELAKLSLPGAIEEDTI